MNLLSLARRPAVCRGLGDASCGRPPRGPIWRGPARPGVTLIELMIALAITMIMMTAVVTLFANLSTTVSNSRALIEISERLRAARNRLQLDLAGHTANTLPPLRPEDGEGYLEIVEGPNSDWTSVLMTVSGAGPSEVAGASVPNPANSQLIAYPGLGGSDQNNNYVYPSSIMGDADDVLALTVRSSGEPFVGWGWNATTANRMLVESPTAEVIWYAVPNGRSLPAGPNAASANPSPIQLYTLYRRVLLVSPQSVPTGPVAAANTASAIQFGAPNGTITTNPATIPLFYNNFDISVRSAPDSTNTYNIAVGNSLSDLTNRQNRFMHGFQITSMAASNYLVNNWSVTASGSNGNQQVSVPQNWPAAVVPPTSGNFGTVNFPYELQSTTPVVQSGNPSLASTLWTMPAALTNGTYTSTGSVANYATLTTLPAPSAFTPALNPAMSLTANTRLGEDVILTDVLSFDIRVFDPMAPLVTAATGEVLVPSDPGYSAATGSVAGFGAFVDMGYNNLTAIPTMALTPPLTYTTPLGVTANPWSFSYFSNFPNAISTTTASPTVSGATQFNSSAELMPQTYCTFSLGFDQDAIDEDGAAGVDQGLDGLDDNPSGTSAIASPDGIVDNVPQVTAPYLVSTGAAATGPVVYKGSVLAGERETLPPYPFPLRGVQVILRVYEPDTRQIRQVTIVQDFLPD